MILKSKSSAFWEWKTKDDATFPDQNNLLINVNEVKFKHFENLRFLLSFFLHFRGVYRGPLAAKQVLRAPSRSFQHFDVIYAKLSKNSKSLPPIIFIYNFFTDCPQNKGEAIPETVLQSGNRSLSYHVSPRGYWKVIPGQVYSTSTIRIRRRRRQTSVLSSNLAIAFQWVRQFTEQESLARKHRRSCSVNEKKLAFAGYNKYHYAWFPMPQKKTLNIKISIAAFLVFLVFLLFSAFGTFKLVTVIPYRIIWTKLSLSKRCILNVTFNEYCWTF